MTTQLEAISVCAWCDFDKTQTRALLAQGKKVSHTCCEYHRDELIERARVINGHVPDSLPQWLGHSTKEIK